jgi:hypothetical protein
MSQQIKDLERGKGICQWDWMKKVSSYNNKAFEKYLYRFFIKNI